MKYVNKVIYYCFLVTNLKSRKKKVPKTISLIICKIFWVFIKCSILWHVSLLLCPNWLSDTLWYSQVILVVMKPFHISSIITLWVRIRYWLKLLLWVILLPVVDSYLEVNKRKKEIFFLEWKSIIYSTRIIHQKKYLFCHLILIACFTSLKKLKCSL